MDANKLKVLQNINYTVRKACGNCQYSRFGHPSANFGTCSKHHYTHLKHSDGNRELSINEFGYCDKHEWWTEGDSFILGAFSQLKEK